MPRVKSTSGSRCRLDARSSPTCCLACSNAASRAGATFRLRAIDSAGPIRILYTKLNPPKGDPMNRRAFTAGTVTTMSGLVLANAKPARAADSVKVGVASVYPTYSIFFATKELGYYKDAGLDVDIQTFRGGPAAQEALAAGAVDLCTILPTAAALAIQKGVKEKIVAMYVPVRAAGWYIMVPSDSPIKTVADLNGKTVGVTQIGSLTDFWVQRIATDAKIT